MIFIRNILIISMNLLVFLNLISYLPTAGFLSIPPYSIYLLMIVVVTVFYYAIKKRIALNIYMMFGIIFYLFVNTVYLLGSDVGLIEISSYKLVIFYLLIAYPLLLVYALDDETLSISRKTIAVSGIIGVLALGIDFLSPGFFLLNKSSLLEFVPGRAAAIYINANIAGNAMNLILLLSIDVIPKKYRIGFIAVIFLGILFTMSRSNIMIILLLIIIFAIQRKISVKSTFASFFGIIFIFIWLSAGGIELLSKNFEIKITENVKNRVDFFAENNTADTYDTNERKKLLQVALNLFANNPILGTGLAATSPNMSTWPYRVGPHNTFARQWAEFGLIGLLIIPLMLFAASYNVFKGHNTENKQLAVLFSVYFIVASFFSHNMFEQEFQIAGMILIASLRSNNIDEET